MDSFVKLLKTLFCKANVIRFVRMVVFFPVSLLARIIPKQKNLIVLGARYGQHFDWEPSFIFSYLCANPDRASFEYVWVCRGKDVYTELKEKGVRFKTL